jgi:hypothetical protein
MLARARSPHNPPVRATYMLVYVHFLYFLRSVSAAALSRKAVRSIFE